MRERLIATWERASTRERVLLVLGGTVLVVGLGWPLLWQPLERDLRRVDEARTQARARVADAREAADEIVGLARTATSPVMADPRAAVERVVASRNLRAALTALDHERSRVRLTFASIDFDALTGFLDVLAREEQLFAIDALLAARIEPGSVRAELTLARPPAR